MAAITLDRVSKVYPDGTEAVADLDLEIDDGEFVVLVGPSGCGKSTALKMVAGLEAVSSGTITIGDQIVNELPPKDRDVAMVFQDYALYPHMTVYQNMAFALKVRKTAKTDIDRKVRATAGILGLDDLLNRRPKALSGGQRQRVAMGRAIVREPRAFLMDEPLSNLDAKLRVQMRSEIRRIQSHLGVTTIYVTHDQTEAMTMGDRVAVLKKGRLQQVDVPRELYDRPVNLFVAGFIGSPAMNMVKAELSREGDRLVANFGSNSLELDPALVHRRPDLRRYESRTIVLGIRPEEIQDPRFSDQSPDGRCVRGEIELMESLGSDVLVHFRVDAPAVLTEDTKELASELEATDAFEDRASENSSSFVARLDPRTEVRVGEAVSLIVDTSRVQVFDPEGGRSIV